MSDAFEEGTIIATFAADVLLTAAVFLLVAIVGTEISGGDFRTIRKRPKSVLVCTAAQLLALPVVAMLCVLRLLPVPAFALGLEVLAICPGGALTNHYVYLSGRYVGLSVTLTTVSMFVYIAAFPVLALGVFSLMSFRVSGVTLPLADTMVSLVAFLLLPVLVGMEVRRRFPDLVAANRRRLNLTAALAVLVTVLISAVEGRAR